MFLCFVSLLITETYLFSATQEEEGIALIEKGEAAYSNGLYQDALAAFNKAMTLVSGKDNLERLFLDLAQVHYALGNSKDCSNMLGFLLDLNPGKEIERAKYPQGFLSLYDQLNGEVQNRLARQKIEEQKRMETATTVKNDTHSAEPHPDSATVKLSGNESVAPSPARSSTKKYPLIKIGPCAGFYWPNDENIKEFYGKSEVIYGGKLGVHVWQGFYVWFAASHYKAIGETIYNTELSLSMTFLSAFLSYNVRLGIFSPYAGIGFTHLSFNEEFNFDNVSGNGNNVAFESGCEVKIHRYFSLDIGARYAQIKVNPTGNETDLGGLQLGIGLLVTF